MADASDATRRLNVKKQTLDDAYAAPANFLEIDVINPVTHGVAKKRYTDYEVRMKTNLPVFKVKESSVRRRYSDFEWLRNELERDSKVKLPRPLFTLPISSSLINILSKNGFSSWEDVINEGGDCNEKVKQILSSHKMTWEEFKKLVEPPPLKSFNQVFKMEAMKLCIPTFSEVLDSKLNGGIPTGTVIHVCGPPGSGKTQFALQLCICVQIPSCLCGLTGEAVFIDTDSGFSISRLSEISEGVINHCKRVAELHNLEDQIQNFTLQSILDKIHYMEIDSSLELLCSVQLLENLISKNPKIKLIVIDSLLFPFHNSPNTLERTRMISSLIAQLYSLAIKFDISVIVTNHVATRLSGNERSIIPALGESFLHHVPITLLMNKAGNDTHTVLIQKANDLPDSLVLFKITSGGIRDHSA